jgi:hypothetical protein
MGVSPSAGAMHERACANRTGTGEDFDNKVDNWASIFAMEPGPTEAVRFSD